MPSIKLTGWTLVVVIVVMFALWFFHIIDQSILEAGLGIVGVGGLAGLRALINSSGYKTYIVVAGGLIATGLFLTKNIDGPTFTTVMVTVLGVSVPTLLHAVKKTPDKTPALKKAA